MDQLENLIIITDPDGLETVIELYPSQIDDIEQFVESLGYLVEQEG